MYKNNIISTKNERLTSGFGPRPNPTGAGTEQHNGCDFTDAQRLELKQDVGILAVADGKVVEVIRGDSVGWTVAISHDGRILSRYQHMKDGSVKIKTGDNIKKGQQIGIMGTTGRSTGIHLHFAVKENSTAYTNGTWVDPIPYLNGVKTIGVAAQPAAVPKPAAPAPAKKSIDEIAREVIRGSWGNGQERVTKLTAAGYSAPEIQARVNQLLK